MNLNRLKKLALLAAMASLLSACANQVTSSQSFETPQKTHRLTDISQLDARDRADLYETIIAADLAASNGDFETATSYYLSATRTSKSIDLIELLIESAKLSDDNLAILQASEMWLAIEPDNIEALSLKTSGVLAHQDIEQAVELTKRLFQQQKESEERAKKLVEMTSNLSPPVINAYFAQLSSIYPESIAVIYARADFLARVAKQTRNPVAIFQQAFAMLDDALAIKNNFIPAVELKTRLYYQAKQDEKAEAFLRKLHSDYPKSRDISQLLGQLLYDLKKYDLSQQHYSSWLKNNPKDNEAHFYLAASYFATSNFSSSLSEYQKILGTNYKPQVVYFFCGNAAGQLKNYPQAIACYDLVSGGPYLTRSKIELAKIYALTNKIELALNTVRNPKFANSENDQIDLINVEVEILNTHISREAAKQRLNTALLTHPDNVNLLFKKIKINQLADKPKQLVTLLKQASAQIDPGEKKRQFNLAVAALLRNNNHFQESVNWLDDGLKNDPDNKDYLYARALYKEPLGLYDEMIDDFKQLLSLEPDNINIKNALGYTLVDNNKELAYAEELIEQAYQAMPNNAAVIDSKGWLAFRKGDFTQAIQFLSVAFKLSPSADVATHIGEVYWASDEKDKALKYWNKAKMMDKDNHLLKITIKRLGVEL